MRPRALLLIVGLSLASLLLLDNASVWARAGSGGSRGSRSYSSPTTPSSPSSPSPVTTPSPSSPQQPMQRPGMFGGLMGGIAGFALGGLLGSMLFGGEGGGFGGGLGLLELLLIGGAVFFLFRMLRGRQAARPEPAYAGAGSAYNAGGQGWSTAGGGTTLEALPSVSDLDRGIEAVVVLLLVVAAIALPRLVDTPRVQAMIAASAAQAIGRPVKFESLSVALFPLPAVELHKLEVAEDPEFGTTPFITLETGRILLKLRPLLGGRVEFGDITLERPRIALIRSADGRLNAASLAPPSESRNASRPGRGSGGPGGVAAAVVSRVKIDSGVIVYVVRGKGEAPTPYRVEDLDLTLTGQGSQLNFKGALRVKPGDLAVTLADGMVALNGAKAVLDAPVRARVSIEGKDIEQLVAAAAGPTPAIAGPIKGDLALGGTLG